LEREICFLSPSFREKMVKESFILSDHPEKGSQE